MTSKVFTTGGRGVMAGAFSALPFIAALSAGDPAWDPQWTDPNPPTPDPDATAIADLIGYVRPSLVDFVEPDPVGAILTEEGGSFTVIAGTSRYCRVRVSIPPGSFPNVYVREIGIFANPTFIEGLAPGKTVLDPGDVVSEGVLAHVLWSPPQFLNAGTAYARNMILKV
jgi:hypothetical protein